MKYYYLNEDGKCEKYTQRQSLEICNPSLEGQSGPQFTNEIVNNTGDFIAGSGLLGIAGVTLGIKLFRGKK